MVINANNLASSLGMMLDLTQKSSNLHVLEDSSYVDYDFRKLSNHSMECSYIALELCREMSLKDDLKHRIYIFSMLHDIGINPSNNYYVDNVKSSFILDHCKKGAAILKDFPKFNGFSDIVLYHHENIDGSGPFKLKGDTIPLESQIIRMADLVDTIYFKNPSIASRRKIINWISDNTNRLFSKTLVNAFLSLSKKEMFWLNLDNLSSYNFIFDDYIPTFNFDINLDEFLIISYIFGDMIDSHSSFTGTHSKGIGDLTYNISGYLNYSREKSIKMKSAGLLHDIGKLAIPKDILNKNGSLSPYEFSIIKSHAYYTYLVLNRIKDIPDICQWASNHHEKLNGNGYPRKLTAANLSFECRIIAVCDIYQALKEDRPYKKGLPNDEIFKILNDLGDNNSLCPKAIETFKKSL